MGKKAANLRYVALARAFEDLTGEAFRAPPVGEAFLDLGIGAVLLRSLTGTLCSSAA
jgi:hypothetical protein